MTKVLNSKPRKHIAWRLSEYQKLRELWDTHTTDEISEIMGRTYKSVVSMASLLELKRPKEFSAAIFKKNLAKANAKLRATNYYRQNRRHD